MSAKIPIVILGGSDRRPSALPQDADDKHPLTGCKGVDVRLGGRCMVDVLIDRLRSFGAFEPISIAGPAHAYRSSSHAAAVIDTDGGFGRNLQVGLETLRERHPGSPIAVTTCDILPEPADLELVFGDYSACRPADLWFPIIKTPERTEELGAAAWKPKYYIVPRTGELPVRVLPGHLAIVDPEALRRSFMYRLFDLAYRTRNRPILYRRAYLARHLVLGILLQDLRLLFRLQPPTLWWEVAGTGIQAARKLKERVITRVELEDALRRMFIKRSHRKRYPERRVQLPILPAMSLARDVDTYEEVVAIGGTAAVHP